MVVTAISEAFARATGPTSEASSIARAEVSTKAVTEATAEAAVEAESRGGAVEVTQEVSVSFSCIGVNVKNSNSCGLSGA